MGRPCHALVVCREILPNLQLMATNSFTRSSSGWHIIGHHSGPVPSVETRQPTAATTSGTARDRRRLH
ncbi:MAG: hypothetical protein Q8K93_29500 [Reyranella sp.]|nr:hypothetical protein [Reyranella sp.]